MGTLTIKSPRALKFHNASPVKERKIEITQNGEVFLQIIYDDDTKLTLRTAHGSVQVSSNELLLMESTPEKTNLTVAKSVAKQEKQAGKNTKPKQAKQPRQAKQPKQQKKSGKPQQNSNTETQ